VNGLIMSTDPITLDRSVPFGAVWTSFTLSLRNLLQWKRLLVMLLLFLLPVIVVVVFRFIRVPQIMRYQSELGLSAQFLTTEFRAVLIMFANVIAPLTMLLFASGMIRDEQENQTLTYLMIRPIPRWAIYLSKLLASILVAWFLTMLGISITMVTLWIGSGLDPAQEMVPRLLWLMPCFGILLAANGAVFACLGVLFRRSLVIGAVYIALFEGFLANYQFVLRKFTNLHYFQCIVVNVLGDYYKKFDQSMNKNEIMLWPLAREVVPDTQESVITLLSVFIVTAIVGMYVFTVREFRMKTPESGGS
jgi:ABC-2 type transport system permease protein